MKKHTAAVLFFLLPGLCFSLPQNTDVSHNIHFFHISSQSAGIYIFIFFILATAITAFIFFYAAVRKSNNKISSIIEEYRKIDSKFRIMAKNSSDVFIFASPSMDKLLYVSPSFERIWGVSTKTLYENPYEYIKYIHPENTCSINELRTGADISEDSRKYKVINKITGETHWLVNKTNIIKDLSGEVTMIAVIVSDITALVNSENSASAQRILLDQKSKYAAMGEMVGAISHQWRQPLNALFLCLQMMGEITKEKEIDREEMNEFLTNSMNLVDHMNATITDFRDFFKPDKTFTDFDAPNTVLQTMRMIEPQLLSYKIDYSLQCSCDFHSFETKSKLCELKKPVCRNVIHGVQNEFKHAVVNILQNSKDALLSSDSKDKKMDVKMGYEDSRIFIHIQDNAGGIDPAIAKDIFEPNVTSKENGTGMGLYLAKKIISGMKGEITAENSEDGALFKISIPCSKHPGYQMEA